MVDWAVPDSPQLDRLTPERRRAVEAMAVDWLNQWTGGVFGTSTVVVRPCRDERRPGWWTTALVRGRWEQLACARCPRRLCDCERTTAVRLPGHVQEVTEVRIDGDVLPASSYRLDNAAILQRTDGGEWPAWQDLAREASEDDTWQVTYRQGVEVPEGGQQAAALLAVQFAKALDNDKSCQLPQRLQSITREGVTVAVLDSFDDIDSGHTGIWMVDSWVASVTKPKVHSSVRSPDLPVWRRP